MSVSPHGKTRFMQGAGLIILVFGCELGGRLFDPVTSFLLVTMVIRSIQLSVLLGAAFLIPGISVLMHMDFVFLVKGVKTGLIWSAGFGILAGITGWLIWISGTNPFALVRFATPARPVDLFLLYLTGGLISPIVEEMVFRGIIFTLLRPLGLMPAVLISSSVFALFHLQGTSLPLIQLVGGIIFALSLERSNSIATPIIIHVLGNIALFSLSVAHSFGISYPF